MIISLLEALIAIPKIAGYVSDAINAVLVWWITKQQTETLAMIVDAASASARAQNDSERYQAADLWRAALERGRVSS